MKKEVITKSDKLKKIIVKFGTVENYQLFRDKWTRECERIRKQFGY